MILAVSENCHCSGSGTRTPIPCSRGMCPIHPPKFYILNIAGRLGFEPRYCAPEAHVLPLDDLPAISTTLCQNFSGQVRRTRNMLKYYILRYLRVAMKLDSTPRDTPTKSKR